MGNPDLVIIVNGICIIVKGNRYDTRDQAIQLAIDKWSCNPKFSDHPETEVNSIKIYEIEGE